MTDKTSQSKEPETLHIHKFEKVPDVEITLHNYVHEGGRVVKDLITGKDVLKRRKCECGAVETYDMERVK